MAPRLKPYYCVKCETTDKMKFNQTRKTLCVRCSKMYPLSEVRDLLLLPYKCRFCYRDNTQTPFHKYCKSKCKEHYGTTVFIHPRILIKRINGDLEEFGHILHSEEDQSETH